MANKKKTTTKKTTKKKASAPKKSTVKKATTETVAPAPVVVTAPTPERVWDKPIIPVAKKKSWFKRLFSWF